MSRDELVRLHFRLEVEDDWPPVGVETLWASRTTQPSEYVLRSIPFFVSGVAWGDTVLGSPDSSGKLHGGSLVHDGGHSTVRIILMGGLEAAQVVEQVEAIRCDVEISPFASLIAIDAPNKKNFVELSQILAAWHRESKIEIEESKISSI